MHKCVCVCTRCACVWVCVLLTGLLKSTQAQLDPRAMRPQSMQQTLLQIAPANALALSLSFTHTYIHTHTDTHAISLNFIVCTSAVCQSSVRAAFWALPGLLCAAFPPCRPTPSFMYFSAWLCMCACAFLLHAVRRSNISVYHWKIYARIFQTVFRKLYRMYFFIFIFPSFWASFFFIYFQCSVAFIWGFWGVAYISRGAFLSILYGSGPKNASL